MIVGLLSVCAAWAADPAGEDPYLWLEDVTGERAMAWVRAQNAVSAKLLQDPEVQALKTRVKAIMDSDARIPYVSKMGDHYYNFWEDATHVRGVWRRTTLDSYRAAEPTWETVLDLDALDAAEGKPWVWHGASCLPPAYQRCLISLSNGGSDADVEREFDTQTRAFVPDGFVSPEGKNSLSWVDQDTLLATVDLGPETLTSSGYPRQVRLWRRGTPLAQAPVIFEGEPTDVRAGAWHDATPGFERTFVYRSPSFFTEKNAIWQDGKLTPLDTPEDARTWVWRDWLLVELHSDWTVGGRTWPSGALLAAPLDGYLAGGRELQAVFTPSPTTALESVDATQSALLLTVLDQVHSRIDVARPADGIWRAETLGGVPELGDVGVSPVDPYTSDAIWLTATDFLNPTALSLGSVAPGAPAPEKLKSLPAFFDARDLEVTQHFATSKDGTTVPYFQVSRKGMKRNGKNPTLLYGYGGFQASMLPSYSGTIGAAWLERGGVYVLANIRGGGEFGPSWHEAALREHRHRAYEDFAAVAQHLIARKVTKPSRLGAMGGSNGGLLVGNMLVQYPKLFGAIVCQVPLLDMKRYSHLLAGASWMEEYGDPDDPAQWAYIQTFSPYHLEQAQAKYPPVLFMTSTRDDRVHPGHARKMAAKMLDQGKDVLYWENTEGGHGAATTSDQRADMWTLAWTFLWQELR